METEYKVLCESLSDVRNGRTLFPLRDLPDEISEDSGWTGNFVREIWMLAAGNAVLHRAYGPAVSIYNVDTGEIVLEEWYRYGERHRIGGPAITRLGSKKSLTMWFEYGEPHRIGGPSRITVDNETGKAETEDWQIRGEFHRVGGPASVLRDVSNDRLPIEAWYQNGKLHREDGPAFVERDWNTGIAVEEFWIVNGEYHRVGGDAIIYRDAATGDILAFNEKDHPPSGCYIHDKFICPNSP